MVPAVILNQYATVSAHGAGEDNLSMISQSDKLFTMLNPGSRGGLATWDLVPLSDDRFHHSLSLTVLVSSSFLRMGRSKINILSVVK
ncbi:hypothetical protein ElyMa_003516000 [Elysia marginata]|uniref:Uncharacterized protein n=1 Tax=Elysia marginata TaxID=1093978 RepID=A0AAV4EFI3_9GAST|nr:hypothetical protein ElyMa_003516000 [Elysia marginata]